MMCLSCGDEGGRVCSGCGREHGFPTAHLAPNHITQVQALLREGDAAGVARFQALVRTMLQRWEARQEALELHLSRDPELARRFRGLVAEFSWLEENLPHLPHGAESLELDHFFLDCCEDLAQAFDGAEALAARPLSPGQLFDWRAA